MSFLSIAPFHPNLDAPISDIDPVLPLDAPPSPFAEPVDVGRSLWGPFRRLYLEVQADGHTHTIRSGLFNAEAQPDGGMRISTTLHVPTQAGTLRTGVTMLRAKSGDLVETELIGPTGTNAAEMEALARLRDTLSGSLGGFLDRRRLGMGELFTLYPSGLGEAKTTAGVPLLCRVLGQSSHQGRTVIVARCSASQAVAEHNWKGLMVADGQVAVDIETGLVLLSALACRVMCETDWPHGGAPIAGVRVKAWFTLH